MKRFKKVYIEITNICNLSCKFCPKTNRTPGYMKKDLFEKILHEIRECAKYIYFHVLGEPLMHPEIGTFLDMAYDSGLKVNITTNGTLIDKVGSMLLEKPALRQLNFSLHSFEANSNINSIDDYLDGIFQFIRRSRERNLLICLRLWNLESGSRSEGNGYILGRIQNEFSLDFKIEEQLTPCKGMKIGDNVFLNQAQTFEWPDLQRDKTFSEDGFCYGLRDQIAILVDGTVVPCCLDGEGTINLGNIRESSLINIIEGDRVKSIFEGFSRRKAVERLCLKCGYRQRFNL